MTSGPRPDRAEPAPSIKNQPDGNEFCLRFANHKFVRGRRIMVRFRIWASSLPLLGLAAFAHGELVPSNRPCMTIGDTPVQLVTGWQSSWQNSWQNSWQDGLRVRFTDDPVKATIHVELTDNAEAADFTVADDEVGSSSAACEAMVPPKLVTISREASARDQVVYLSSDGPADYRIFVKSATFTAQEVAAMLVGARGNRRHLASLF